jgi:hypothetical protein
MVQLTEDERTVLEHIAEQPLAPVSPLQAIVDELIALELVTVDSNGLWVVTEAGASALRDDSSLH